MTASDITKSMIRLAREYADQRVPYVHRGTSRRGCDCTGMLIGICRELGFLADYQLRQYPLDWNLHSGAGDWMVEELDQYAIEIDNAAARPGDVAIMIFGRCKSHCGLIVAPGLMVHSFRDAKCCCYGKLASSPWSARWKSTYRFVEAKLCG